jgi:hypothetical protein
MLLRPRLAGTKASGLNCQLSLIVGVIVGLPNGSA